MRWSVVFLCVLSFPAMATLNVPCDHKTTGQVDTQLKVTEILKAPNAKKVRFDGLVKFQPYIDHEIEGESYEIKIVDREGEIERKRIEENNTIQHLKANTQEDINRRFGRHTVDPDIMDVK